MQTHVASDTTMTTRMRQTGLDPGPKNAKHGGRVLAIEILGTESPRAPSAMFEAAHAFPAQQEMSGDWKEKHARRNNMIDEIPMQVAQNLCNPVKIRHRITGRIPIPDNVKKATDTHESCPQISRGTLQELQGQMSASVCRLARPCVTMHVFSGDQTRHTCDWTKLLGIRFVSKDRGAMFRYRAHACCHVFPSLLVDHGARRAFMSQPVSAYIPAVHVRTAMYRHHGHVLAV